MACLPTFTVVIPIRRGSPVPHAAQSVRNVDYPQELIEIVLVEGANPSLQRNAGIQSANGELIYLLDDDSVLSLKAMRYAVECFAEHPEPHLVCVGGPVLTIASDTPFQKAVGAAMGSVFGLGPNRHRHVSYGLVRSTTEKELISANMVLRRVALDRAGGFDERIYPNEENEFLKRVQYAGMGCMYHPLVVVFGSRRKNLWQVFVQNFCYGRGRAQHYFKNIRAIDAVFWAPTLLLLSFVACALWPRWYTALPVGFYTLMTFFVAAFIGLAMRHTIRSFFYLLLIFPFMHLSYGIGFLAGFVRIGLKRRKIDRNVIVRRIRELGDTCE